MSEDKEIDTRKRKLSASYWEREIKRATFKEWLDEVKGYNREYRGQADKRAKVNIYWSNLETMKPVIYSRVPQVVIAKRWKDKDPIATLSAEALERATEYEVDTQDFNGAARSSRDDYLHTGRGVLWERFQPEFDDIGALTGVRTITDYVHYRDFFHSPARTWDDVTWVARQVFLLKEDARQVFSASVVQALKYTYTPEGMQTKQREGAEQAQDAYAKVYEIWDKPTRKVYFISEGYSKVCKTVDDPLGLKNFFPCARPMYASTTTDSLEPIPDYRIYRELCRLLDLITRRVDLLTDALKVVGIYDTTAEGIEALLRQGETNIFVGVKNYAALSAQGGSESLITFFPVEKIAATIRGLLEIQAEVKQWIFEVSGMSDLMRGQSDPSETATAQQIKGQFATMRVADRQGEFQRFLKDQLAIKAEIIAEHYPIEFLAQIVGPDLASNPEFPQAVEILRRDLTRCYKIDIETDSTIAIDEQVEKQQSNEFLGAFGQAFQQFASAAGAMPDWVPIFGEVLRLALRPYRVGRQVNDMIDQTLEATYARQQQAAQQPPPPDPAQVQAEQEAQFKQVEMQARGQLEAAKLQLEQSRMAMDYEKVAKELQLKEAALMAELEKARKEAKLKLMELQATLELKSEEARNKIALEALKLSNTPQNEETTKTKESIAATAATPPPAINISLGQPRKKVTFGYDAAGNRTAIAEDMEEPTVEVE